MAYARTASRSLMKAVDERAAPMHRSIEIPEETLAANVSVAFMVHERGSATSHELFAQEGLGTSSSAKAVRDSSMLPLALSNFLAVQVNLHRCRELIALMHSTAKSFVRRLRRKSALVGSAGNQKMRGLKTATTQMIKTNMQRRCQAA